MRILVDKVTLIPGCTIALGYGADEEAAPVTFCGEHRAMQHIAEALDTTGSSVIAEVEPWQLRATGKA